MADRVTCRKCVKSFDGIDEWKTHSCYEVEVMTTPTCFGEYSMLSPSGRAENSCHDCPFRGACTGEDDGFRRSVLQELGTKTDAGKHRWSLLPSGTIQQVIAVLEFGAEKYSVGNWIKVPDANTRYYDAVMRHVEAWRGGEKEDPESGLPHLAHAAACLLFLMWFDGKSVTGA